MTGYLAVAAGVAAVVGVVQLLRRRLWTGAAAVGLAVWLLVGSSLLDLAAAAAVTTCGAARRRPGPVWSEPGEDSPTMSDDYQPGHPQPTAPPAEGQHPERHGVGEDATRLAAVPGAPTPALARPYVHPETAVGTPGLLSPPEEFTAARMASFWSRQAAVYAVQLVPGVDWHAVATWVGGHVQDRGDGVPALVLGDAAATEGDWVVDAPAGAWPMSDKDFRDRLAPTPPAWPTVPAWPTSAPVDDAAVERRVLANLGELLVALAARCGTATHADVTLRDSLLATRELLDRVHREVADRGRPLGDLAVSVRAGEPLL